MTPRKTVHNICPLKMNSNECFPRNIHYFPSCIIFLRTFVYASYVCFGSLRKKTHFFSFLKFIIGNLHWSQKLHMFSTYRQEYNFGKYTIDDKLFFLCHSRSLTIEGYFLMKEGKGARQSFKSFHVFFFH